jgi:hypothetical protein
MRSITFRHEAPIGLQFICQQTLEHILHPMHFFKSITIPQRAIYLPSQTVSESNMRMYQTV